MEINWSMSDNSHLGTDLQFYIDYVYLLPDWESMKA